MKVVRDDDVRSGDPHIEGSRITVLDVKRRVVDNDEDPHVVAGEYDISLESLYDALSYYYGHREELQARESESKRARREGERRTRELLDDVERGEQAGQIE